MAHYPKLIEYTNITGGTGGTSLYEVGIGVDSTQRCGVNNFADADYSLISGGFSNTILPSTVSNYYNYGSVIAGGNNNFISCMDTNSSYCIYGQTIGGGSFNTISSTYWGDNISSNTIAGGNYNCISFSNGIGGSTIGGGECNTSLGIRTTIGGGCYNTTLNALSTISGGFANTSTGNFSIVGGGYLNTVCGNCSSVLGGYNNKVIGDCSAILAGVNITAIAANTAYVPNLNIRNIGSGTPLINLGLDNSGFVVTGSTSINTFTTGFTYSNNTFTISRNQGQPSLTATINTVTGLTVNGNLTVTGNTSLQAFTGTTGLISAATQNVLTIVGSGNTTSPSIFTVQGSSGELFSVSDSLVGSLFSVNDISGLPVIEAFSNNTILMGSYLAPSLNTTTRVIATTGTTNVYSIPTSAYTGAFFDYTVSDGTNLRAGNIMSIWSGTSVNITETQTTDFGNTSGLTFNMVVSSNNAILRTSGVTGNWTVKTIVRSI